jgi:hypothetical protein
MKYKIQSHLPRALGVSGCWGPCCTILRWHRRIQSVTTGHVSRFLCRRQKQQRRYRDGPRTGLDRLACSNDESCTEHHSTCKRYGRTRLPVIATHKSTDLEHEGRASVHSWSSRTCTMRFHANKGASSRCAVAAASVEGRKLHFCGLPRKRTAVVVHTAGHIEVGSFASDTDSHTRLRPLAHNGRLPASREFVTRFRGFRKLSSKRLPYTRTRKVRGLCLG